MPRYFLELAYKGNNYSGFQIQRNANSIQQEVARALEIFFRREFVLTGSSRTDGGVHALQNYFHFDYEGVIEKRVIYNINAILPPDIAIKGAYPVTAGAHCRFDAVSREYRYYIYRKKDPFLADRAFFYPYTLDREKLNAAAALVPQFGEFASFAKRNAQAKTFDCTILESGWQEENGCLVYRVAANRFLRGMVRGLVGTMLLVGRGRIGLEEFATILRNQDNQQADFSVPGHGLFLVRISFPDSI
ncbi:MAG TPA: tRNA pseudouridine(38-40) synthase TruA, partial [Puia sp.]|nr:tRNA pseudouridine(38-40) synthase TruA [Puia sp.]